MALIVAVPVTVPDPAEIHTQTVQTPATAVVHESRLPLEAGGSGAAVMSMPTLCARTRAGRRRNVKIAKHFFMNDICFTFSSLRAIHTSTGFDVDAHALADHVVDRSTARR